MSRPTRDGTAEPVSQDQILRHERGQRNINFAYSADHVQDWQPYPVDPYSCYMCVTIHTSCTRPKSLSGLVLQSRIIVVLAYRRRGTKTSVNSPFSSKKPVTRPNFNRKRKRLSSLAHCLHQSTLIQQRHHSKTKNECFNDWGGRGYDDSVPGEVPKTPSSGGRTT